MRQYRALLGKPAGIVWWSLLETRGPVGTMSCPVTSRIRMS